MFLVIWLLIFLLCIVYNIIINKIICWDIVWILDVKYENKDKMKLNVMIIVFCKLGKLNKMGRFLLVIDSIIDEEILRFGDSDFFL